MKNAQKLITKIRLMVEREVKKQVKSILAEHILLSKEDYGSLLEAIATKSNVQEHHTSQNVDAFADAAKVLQDFRNSGVQSSQPQQQAEPALAVPTHTLKTGKGKIDEVLASMRGGIVGEYSQYGGHDDGQGGDFNEIAGGVSDTQTFSAAAMHAGGAGNAVPVQTRGTGGQQIDINSSAGKSLASALTKDYSGMMSKK